MDKVTPFSHPTIIPQRDQYVHILDLDTEREKAKTTFRPAMAAQRRTRWWRGPVKNGALHPGRTQL